MGAKTAKNAKDAVRASLVDAMKPPFEAVKTAPCASRACSTQRCSSAECAMSANPVKLLSAASTTKKPTSECSMEISYCQLPKKKLQKNLNFPSFNLSK